jgi:Subtilisin inhibitor-like
MRGVVALVAVLAAAMDCGAGQSAPNAPAQTPETDLQVTLWEDGREQKAAPTRWTLKCDPNAGTLPRRVSACDRLGRMSTPFAPLPKDIVCTDQYGGPQQAVIAGRHEGKRIWIALSARNGCEIGRWNKLRFLLGGMAAGAASA